ncbi:MAG: ImmA/IrrE family metallo-endopeptidase [Bacteroidota bacterium]
MPTEYNIKNIYRSLQNYGIDRKFIQDIILPSWWEDEIANSKTGYLQTASLISKNLGIAVTELINTTNSVALIYPANIKFKSPRNVSINASDIWPNSLAVKISETIDQLYSTPLLSFSNNPLEIRRAIIEQYGKIDLNNTLEYLWSSGIPVLHVPVFPKEVNKMDGMAVNLNGRPLIILSKNRRHDAWLLFILAHELGHIINGHLSSTDQIIYDVNLETEADDEERVANDFAAEFLNGTKSPSYFPSNNSFNSPYGLVNYIRPLSKKLSVDPGIIALNYAYKTKNYALAEKALNILAPKADAVKLIQMKMKTKLDLEKLSEENFDYFTKLTSLSED